MPAIWAADYKYTALRPPALLYQFIHLLFESLLNIPGIYYPIFHFVTPLFCSSLSLKGVDLIGPHLEVVKGKPDQGFPPCRLALPIPKLNL